VRLISPEGEQLGILESKDALEKAKEYGLDLVEIAPNANPPVCKIADYGKMRYEYSKKQKLQSKKSVQIVTKTVKLKPNIGENDLARKLADTQRFLNKGCRVSIIVEMRGRENRHPEKAIRLLETAKANIEADIFEKIQQQGNRVSMVVAQSSSYIAPSAATTTKEEAEKEKGSP